MGRAMAPFPKERHRGQENIFLIIAYFLAKSEFSAEGDCTCQNFLL